MTVPALTDEELAEIATFADAPGVPISVHVRLWKLLVEVHRLRGTPVQPCACLQAVFPVVVTPP